jgi:hypothetical protein
LKQCAVSVVTVVKLPNQPRKSIPHDAGVSNAQQQRML